jgi:hypothetical protein
LNADINRGKNWPSDLGDGWSGCCNVKVQGVGWSVEGATLVVVGGCGVEVAVAFVLAGCTGVAWVQSGWG